MDNTLKEEREKKKKEENDHFFIQQYYNCFISVAQKLNVKSISNKKKLIVKETS